MASWALGTAVLRGDGGGLCGLAAISSQRCDPCEVARCTLRDARDFKGARLGGLLETGVISDSLHGVAPTWICASTG